MRAKVYRAVFTIAAGVALLCAPAILLSERLGRADDSFQLIQLLACLISSVASAIYLVRSSTERDGWRRFAWLVTVTTTGWLIFVVVVALLYASTMARFD